MRNYTSFHVRPDFCTLIALSLLILPVNWVFGWVIAACVHELFHILMMRILKIRMESITLGASGAQIVSEPMTSLQELLCAFAGPLGGLLMLFLIRLTPHIALSAAVQSVYNLLPVYPLDGGRAVKCAIACLWGEEKAQSLSKALGVIVIILITVIGVWLSCSFQLGLLPLLFPAVPLIYCVYKNSLQSRENNCTISVYASHSERTIHR